MIKHIFPPHRVFDVYCTEINRVHMPNKIFAEKACKQVVAATSWASGKNITICCSVSDTI